MAQPRKALGKGFTALVPSEAPGEELIDLPLDHIIPNRYQPRRIFRPEELSELALSLKTNGVIQPIIVRRGEGGKYELIAGERRWRAAQIAGLVTLPAWVRELPEGELLEWALVENLHREDLNPIETAQAYQKLITERGLTQEQVSERVGQERSTVANTLRLLQLSEEIQRDLSDGRLTMGHAKAILSAGEPEAQRVLWLRIVSEKLTVRQAEAVSLPSSKGSKPASPKAPELLDLEGRLSQSLGTRVRIEPKKKGGKVVVEFYSLEELDRLLDRLL
jgi:ParB family chromosome partitioning protein